MRHIGGNEPVAVYLAEEAHTLIVEWNGLNPEGRKVMQLMIDIDRRLKH